MARPQWRRLSRNGLIKIAIGILVQRFTEMRDFGTAINEDPDLPPSKLLEAGSRFHHIRPCKHHLRHFLTNHNESNVFKNGSSIEKVIMFVKGNLMAA